MSSELEQDDGDDAALDFPTLPPLPKRSYKTLKIDPPWAYRDDLPGPGRGSNSHYDTLHADTVAGMAPQIRKATASSAHAYMWVTNSFLKEGLEILDAWGFEYKTQITWVKVVDEPSTLPFERDEPAEIKGRIGMGHYTRNTTEHLLLGVKGRKGTNRDDVPGHFFAERGEHSAKPEKAYRLVEELSDGPRLEMFGRRARDGWDVWGDEAPDDVATPD